MLNCRALHEFEGVAESVLVFQLALYHWVERRISETLAILHLLYGLPQVDLILFLLGTTRPSGQSCTICFLQAVLFADELLLKSDDSTSFVTMHSLKLLSWAIDLALTRIDIFILLCLHHLSCLET